MKSCDTIVPSISAPATTYTAIPARELRSGERRMEGEAYLTGGYAIQRLIQESVVPSVPVARLADVSMPGRLKGIRVAREHGVPFLTATQVFDIRPVARKWLAPGRTAGLADRY